MSDLINDLLDKIKNELQERCDITRGTFYVTSDDDVVTVNCKFEFGKLIDLKVDRILSMNCRELPNVTEKIQKLLDTDKNFKYINNY